VTRLWDFKKRNEEMHMKNTIYKLTMIISATLALTACPSKSSKSPVINGNGQACVNCGFQQTGIKVQFSQNMVSNINQGSLILSLSADAQQLSFWSSQGQNPIFAYAGEAIANGTLSLTSDLFMGLCRLPAGQYQVMTQVQAGVYNSGVFQFPTISLVGPVTMTASLIEGVILTDGMGQIRGMSALLIARSGMHTYNNWYGGAPQPGGQAPCQDSIGVRF
jgi:hypothetical protein